MKGNWMSNQIDVAHSIQGVSKGRPDGDFYPTPPYATQELLKREVFCGSIYEPACGDGAISEVLKDIYPKQKIYSTDLYDRGYGDKTGIDFIAYDYNIKRFDNIITNPPYSLAQDFVEKSLQITNNKVAMLLKIQFLEGVKRYNMFKSTPLKSIYVFSKRLNMTRNGDRMKNSTMLCFAWFVWDKGYHGKPQVDWIK